MNFKKFRSTTGPIRVTSLAGHVAMIEDTFVSIPEVLWGSAYSQGAIAEDTKVNDYREYAKEQKELMAEEEAKANQKLKEKLQYIYDNPNGYVNSGGDLMIRKAVAYLKEPVKSATLLKIWDEIVSENTK